VNGKQPITNENPIIDIPIRTVSKKKLNKISHILSTVKNKNEFSKNIDKLLFISRNNRFITKN